MKKIIPVILIFFVSLAFSKPVLSIYVWSSSLPQSITKQFTQETGIPVSMFLYDSNEAMYAKLKGNPNLAYDIVFPSSYFVARMIKQHLLQPLDHQRLPNARYIDTHLLNQHFDLGNDYTYPFMWGMSGIAYNDQYIKPDQVTQWEELWSPHYIHQVLWLSDVREVFAMALIRLGYSVNDDHYEHIKQAYELLKKGLANVKVINTDAMQSMFIDEDITLGLAWSLSVYQASKSNPHIRFSIPKGRIPFWLDCVSVPAGSKHPKLAMQFINFLMRPDIAAKLIKEQGVSTGNTAAMASLPARWRNDPAINPSESVLARGEVEDDVGEARKWYSEYWLKLRLSTA